MGILGQMDVVNIRTWVKGIGYGTCMKLNPEGFVPSAYH